MRHCLSVIVLLLCLALAGTAKADISGAVPTGLWMTADHTAVIQIAPCKTGLCGEIVGIHLKHPGDPMPQDWQGQPQCGLTIIQTTAVTSSGGNTVYKGYVLDPRDGAFHPALLALDAFRRLILRGYMFLPFLGRSTTWTAYTGPTLPHSRVKQAAAF
jgi:uncharacterized protein (DUF2147 family)